MAAAIIAGIALGLISIIPFRFAMQKSHSLDPTHTSGLLGPFLLTILVSFIILIAGMVACKLIAPGVAMVFSLAEILAFVVGVIVYGVVVVKGRES